MSKLHSFISYYSQSRFKNIFDYYISYFGVLYPKNPKDEKKNESKLFYSSIKTY